MDDLFYGNEIEGIQLWLEQKIDLLLRFLNLLKQNNLDKIKCELFVDNTKI